ncbi:MAG TPA: S9 family peptidase, partial [Gammaproteobacteria bacterium]|nr:S9 family peptidase [Gammaproteobacteria bacterium]
HLDRLRIPIQIHQGRNDMRVTEAETARLVKKIRQRGIEVEYYVYDDEGHGFLRFSDQKRAYERVLAFLQRHSNR